MGKEYTGKMPTEGEFYGSLILTGKSWFIHQKGGRRLLVEAICKCGLVKGYAYRFLLNNNTSSCGCVRKEKILASNVTHNLSRHPLYSVYSSMIARCYHPSCEAYENYGGRGISICQDWLNDIHSFRGWAMVNGYEKGLQIDRINNDGNYEPSNCRFVTKDENNKNTRRNVLLTAFGETKIVTDWAKDNRCVVNAGTLFGRLKVGDWSIEDAITTPAHGNTSDIIRRKQGRMIEAWGEIKSLIGWSEDERCKVTYSGLKIRIRKGWDAEKSISTPPLRNDKK